MLEIKNLRPWEEVLMVLRRHWIVYVIVALYFIFWIIITISLYIIFWFSNISNLLNVIFWLFFSIFLYIEWLNHELDLYVVSNNRIIWVEQISFLNRTVSECNLGQVQEVNSSTKGFFSNMFNYWTLSIQTAGNVTTMQMAYCPDSIQEARKVLNIVDAYRDTKGWRIKDIEVKTE
jgi:membrane protein YdbS with pleckstrin-like domain